MIPIPPSAPMIHIPPPRFFFISSLNLQAYYPGNVSGLRLQIHFAVLKRYEANRATRKCL